MASTYTVQSAINFSMTHTQLRPIVGIGGFTNEPALSLSNDVLQEMLFAPFNWKFNRQEPQFFVTQQNKRDYLYAGAVAFVISPGGTGAGAAIDLASNTAISESGITVTVNVLEPLDTLNFKVGNTVFMFGNTVAAYNSSSQINAQGFFSFTGGWTITAVPSATQFQFTHLSAGLGPSGAAGISNYGWLESASVLDITSTQAPTPQFPIQAVKSLDPQSELGNPTKVAVVNDLGTGVVKFRLWPCPSSYTWGVAPIYQAKAPLITSLASTIAPIPDELSSVFRQGFLAACYRFADEDRYQTEYARFQMLIQKALGIKDSETGNEGFYPSTPILLG